MKTIISIVPSPPTEELTSFCSYQGIRNIHLKVDKKKEKNPLTNSIIVQALEVQLFYLNEFSQGLIQFYFYFIQDSN